MDREWKQNTIDARNPEKFYYDIRNEKIYEQFVEKRNAQRIWHQARLGVIPTNSFLKKLTAEIPINANTTERLRLTIIL